MGLDVLYGGLGKAQKAQLELQRAQRGMLNQHPIPPLPPLPQWQPIQMDELGQLQTQSGFYTGSTATTTGDDYTLKLNEPPSFNKRTFYRINQKVGHIEGATFEEPLDELRIEVAKWLN